MQRARRRTLKANMIRAIEGGGKRAGRRASFLNGLTRHAFLGSRRRRGWLCDIHVQSPGGLNLFEWKDTTGIICELKKKLQNVNRLCETKAAVSEGGHV